MTPARFPFVLRTGGGVGGLAPVPPITLSLAKVVAVSGLLDTGAAVSVLPYSVGVRLGADWDQQTTVVPLAGNLAAVDARGLVVDATVGPFPPVRLAFAWAKTDAVPLILGQVNFFLEFDVCFFRAKGAFDVSPKGP